MLCEKCGTVIPAGSETCPNCGAPAPKTIDQTPIPDFSEISSPVSEVISQEEITNVSEPTPDLNHSNEIPQTENVGDTSMAQPTDTVQDSAPVAEVVSTEMNTMSESQPVTEVVPNEEVVPEVSEPVIQSMTQTAEPVQEIAPAGETQPVVEATLEGSVQEVNAPTTQGGIPLATSTVVEPEPVMEQPVDELEVNIGPQENNTTWTDEEKPEEKKVVHMPSEPQPVVKAQESSAPMEKPDLLRGMNELTPQEYAELEKKRIAREKTNRMVQMINKIALLLVGIVIVGVVGFFGYQYFFVSKDTTEPFSYNIYTFQIDQNYKVTEQESAFVIESKDQSASMNVQILPDSYLAFENGYLSNQENFINQMKMQYGVDAVKRVEQKNIEGQSFIMITRTTETDSSYIIYTTTPDDKIILATYVPKDQILNQTQADEMTRNLLNIVLNEK